MLEVPAEDAKLVTLARASRARTRALEGAAVRDTDGRTYSACTVDLGTVQLSALQLAVAMALASGVKGLEAAAVVVPASSVVVDVEVVRHFAGAALPVVVADGNGEVLDVIHT
ncbi:cytidine deaminase [Kribbella sp. NBC_01245]|uniref:cytidine deaminase n=1 Tax=Kribbella sp. NBC_01245 TaxID=2903578 RepID=UPI002E2B9FAA|nr:cytidine deaminase [Kribbella sp. NBC_01245]